MAIRLKDFDWSKVPTQDAASADPAAAAASQLVYTCPAGKKALFIAAQQGYIRDANAANVVGLLVWDDGTNVLGRYPLQGYLTASVTWYISWAAGCIGTDSNPYSTGSLPSPGIPMEAGHRITVYWISVQAGDNGGPIYHAYKEVDAV